MKKLLLIILLFLSPFAYPDDITYVLGDTAYTYSSQAQPNKGSTYVDATYNTTVKRLTDYSERSGAHGTMAGYSTWNPLSSDGNYLIFMSLDAVNSANGYVCYNASDNSYNSTVSGYFATYLQWWNGQDPEPRWDTSGSHPELIYYRKDKQLRSLNVSNGTDSLVHDFTSDFPTYGSTYYIYNGEEGISSDDSRYWAFMMRNASSPYDTVLLFVYDKTDNHIESSKTISYAPNNVGMSPSGDYVYAAYDYISGANTEFDGPHVYTRSLASNKKVCNGIPHLCWAYDAQGYEVLFFMNGDYVSFVRADTGTKYDLYYQGDLGWDESNLLHCAPRLNKKGWGFVSTYSANNNEWDYNQIFAFELDENKVYGETEPRIWRVSFTQNIVGAEYYYQQPNAQMSLDGTKIWWGANWRSTTGHMEVYSITLPANWYTDLGGEEPPAGGATVKSSISGNVLLSGGVILN